MKELEILKQNNPEIYEEYKERLINMKGEYVCFEDKKILLLQDAFVDGINGEEYYRASGLDQDGNEYYIRWDLIQYDDDYELDDESNACDWENPSQVILI